MVDPVRLFLSLSLKTVFHRKPPPITIWAVADINIDVCKWVVRTEATAHHLSGSGLREEKPKKHMYVFGGKIQHGNMCSLCTLCFQCLWIN